MTDFIPPTDPQGSTPYPLHEWGERPARDPRIKTPKTRGKDNESDQQAVVFREPQYPRHSLAFTALIFSILGFVSAGILSIVGMLMARSDLMWIENRATDPRYHDLAQAAFIVGLVSFLLPMAVVTFVVIMAVFAAS